MKRKKAVALKYKKDYKAPVVTAVGFGEIAERILNKAKENDIPIIEDAVLVDKLSRIEPSTPIPEELYEAVARIIAFIYSLDEKHKMKE
ncbi:EscU/YscU/HrcU family type III secretion system export apparatus switch protein [Caloramator sp. mosi_1]|uniref:EscU/YscU/HrcU family type III secretion system export apparatus switch protein n=1 Tax=Caloramator sp. mosi_1 TaxID=3023090 RepID=UPI00235F92D7|nr:EscU/YscU/HrcU family type III secretion system export apparatus switch protein [Caloramator sp. mosi_1]WDC84327.1 EscU/YscU/HrcU family type III secretion system export apparatus switch protein [Caloramator sp. mosi_1]